MKQVLEHIRSGKTVKKKLKHANTRVTGITGKVVVEELTSDGRYVTSSPTEASISTKKYLNVVLAVKDEGDLEAKLDGLPGLESALRTGNLKHESFFGKDGLLQYIVHRAQPTQTFSIKPLRRPRGPPDAGSALTLMPLPNPLVRAVISATNTKELGETIHALRAACATSFFSPKSLPSVSSFPVSSGPPNAGATIPTSANKKVSLVCSVTANLVLSRAMVEMMLARAFLCALPGFPRAQPPSPHYGRLSFAMLLANGEIPVAAERIKCILAYFRNRQSIDQNTERTRETNKNSSLTNTICFERVSPCPAAQRADWWASCRQPLCQVRFEGGLRLECLEDVDAIVDFANSDLHVGEFIAHPGAMPSR